MVNLFSIPSFFIVLREVLEACLVVGIVLAYLKKTGNTHLNKWVISASITGVVISLAFGITFAVIYYTAGRNFFSGKVEKVFEGIMFLLAAALLTWMIVWMQKMGQKFQTKLEDDIERIIEKDEIGGGKWGLFVLVFVQILREGIETVIFLFGAANASDDENAWRSIPIPGILALIVGLGSSYALFKGFINLDISSLFLWSSIILMLFSAGLTSHAFHELQEADWFGSWAEEKTERDWWNARLWSTKDCCNDKKNEFFAFLRALFGYQDTPTFLEWGTYFAYWIVVIAILLYFNWGAVRKATSKIAKMTKFAAATAFSFGFIAFIYVCLNVTWNGMVTMTIMFILSLISMVVVFDAFAQRIAPVMKSRKSLSLMLGVAFALLAVFIAALHIAQMACDEDGVATCSLPKFYYVGLIFAEDWASQGRSEDGNSWVSLAVLSWSLVAITALLGVLSFGLIVFSGNMDGDGKYLYNEDSEESVESEEDEPIPEASEAIST